MDEADVDCEADIPESSPPPPPVLQQGWQRSLTQAAASLMQTVKDRLRREQRLEALIEQVRLLEKKVAAQSPRAFIIAPLTSLAPEPFEVVKEIKVVIEKYKSVLAAADVYTKSTVFWVMESIRLDLGFASYVHP